MSIDAMKAALAALERLGGLLTHKEVAVHAALRLAIEQAEKQEPAILVQAYRTSDAYSVGYEDGKNSHVGCGRCGDSTKPCDIGGCAASLQPQPKQEPVAWTVAGQVTNWSRDFSAYRTQHYVRPVFAAPPQKQTQEPLGFMNAGHVYEMQQGRLPYGYVYPKAGTGAGVAVYTTPPQRQPLTPREISEFVGTHEFGPEQLRWFRFGEAAHGVTGEQK